MLFKPIPDRSRDIASVNVMEFLLRKQAHMIYTFLLSPKYLLLYDKSHSYTLFSNHRFCSQLSSTNTHNIQNNWMYVDVSFSHGDKSFPISAMIDTGCTYCVIDSTFAVDSCGITPQNPDYNGYNTSRDRTRIFYTTIPILCVGGKEFTEVKCAIIDLSGKFQTNHRFIIGADILSKELWKFNLKSCILECLDKNSSLSYKSVITWDKRSALFYNGIVLKAKVNGKKAFFLFDTGSRYNQLPKEVGILPTDTIVKEFASIATPIVWKNRERVQAAQFSLSSINLPIDFLLTNESIGYLNIEVLLSRTFIIDYTKKRILLVE